MSAKRVFFVGGNWKMNGSRESIGELLKSLNHAELAQNVETVVCPPALYLDYVSNLVPSSFSVGAQNVWNADKGAFTGELSPLMLKDLGINWVIIGHSERRTVNKESNELLAKKTAAALKHGVNVIFCIGELLAEREAGQCVAVLHTQLAAVKDSIGDWSKVVIAYEPVWAIGTGKVATSEQAQEAHHHIRQWLSANVSAEVAAATRIIYGGSVKSDNAGTLAQCGDVDGFLVGGASLVASEFAAIINCKHGH